LHLISQCGEVIGRRAETAAVGGGLSVTTLGGAVAAYGLHYQYLVTAELFLRFLRENPELIARTASRTCCPPSATTVYDRQTTTSSNDRNVAMRTSKHCG
jgi:hypothetical protein